MTLQLESVASPWAGSALLHDVSAQSRSAWRKKYARWVTVGDGLVLAVAIAASSTLRFGVNSDHRTGGEFVVSYTSLGVILWIGWMVSLQFAGARDERVLGGESLELRRIVNSSVLMFGVLAIASVLFKVDMSRGYLALAFPLGTIALVLARVVARSSLRGLRAEGRALERVLLVGATETTRRTIDLLGDNRRHGLAPVAVWAPYLPAGGFRAADFDASLQTYGPEIDIEAAIIESQATMVIVSESAVLGHDGLKELAWRLEALDVELLISPNVVDVANARLHLTTLASMPFLHVDEPQYAAAAEWPKVIFDRVGAAFLLVALSPLLLAAAVAVKLSSRGPAFYRQERIGLDGTPFSIVKFRSMRVNADAELHSLLAAEGQEQGPLAKLTRDPRVTRIGAFIRRFSIDELPQLFNVVKGDMSLVGPRPQRQFEVDQYDHAAHRRLRVRPGVTGLWQVSGRSDLAWEDAIRLDTYYVENWSMVADLVILWRTVRAVLTSDGAY